MSDIGISVLMSVYARESPAYLRKAFESLQGQTSPATEIILVCDGHLGPELEAVISAFTSLLPLTVIRLPCNVGLPIALNAGLGHCTYEWVARFDTDDVCEPERFKLQREYIRQNPEVEVFGSSIAEFDSDETTPYAVRKVAAEHDAILRFAKRRSPLNHMTVVYRKQAVLAVGGYPRDHLYEDYGLWVKLLQAGHRFGNLDSPLVRARAGRSMAARRGGLAYLRAEIAAQTRFWRSGFINTREFAFNVCVRTAVRLAPVRVRAMLYRHLLRSR
jgi:glycosyltransferase involved in cell wall biosynthesis